MTISANVRKELFEVGAAENKLIRIKPTEAKAGTTVYSSKQSQPLKMWTQEEHEKFLEAMEKFPAGPWKVIAAFIGTKTTRQTMTHAQKYRQKISRWRRGLRHKGRKQASDGHGSASGSDSEYAGRSNLMKVAELVAGENRPFNGNVRMAEPDAGNQLFRLAELASIEVMKDTPSRAGSPNPAAQENASAVANTANTAKDERPSREWQKTDVKLSPLRQSEKQRDLSAAFQQRSSTESFQQAMYTEEEVAAAAANGSFRLPPLIMPQNGGLNGIPPLRSKIDPSVLGRAQFAATN